MFHSLSATKEEAAESRPALLATVNSTATLLLEREPSKILNNHIFTLFHFQYCTAIIQVSWINCYKQKRTEDEHHACGPLAYLFLQCLSEDIYPDSRRVKILDETLIRANLADAIESNIIMSLIDLKERSVNWFSEDVDLVDVH